MTLKEFREKIFSDPEIPIIDKSRQKIRKPITKKMIGHWYLNRQNVKNLCGNFDRQISTEALEGLNQMVYKHLRAMISRTPIGKRI